jgi:hypothetical protein
MEYKRTIFEALAAGCGSKDESRKKIVESKEINIIITSLEDTNTKILLAVANLLLSLSRSPTSIKKYLIDFDINAVLFKLSNHTNIEIQIAITNCLCNFLLESTSVSFY